MATLRIRDGFVGQKQWVIPRAVLSEWLTHPILTALTPTDIGWYPSAQFHYRERENGADQHILIFCAAGSGWCEINGRRFEIVTNEALIIPRNVPHIYGSSYENPWSIHWAHFVGSEGDFFVYHLPADEYKLTVETKCAHAIRQLFEECYTSFVGGFVLHRFIYCTQIVHHLLGNLFFNNAAFSPMLRATHFRSIEPTIAYLHQHLHQLVSLQEMAYHAGLSPSHFSHLFKQQTGYSPMDYFIHLKIQYACGLLTVTNKPIHEVALEVGYEDAYYFSRLFKKFMSLSPRQYRETHQL